MGLLPNRGYIDRANRKHAEYSAAIRHIFLESFHEVVRCEYPLHTSPRVAGGIIQLHNRVFARCIENHGWPLDSLPRCGATDEGLLPRCTSKC